MPFVQFYDQSKCQFRLAFFKQQSAIRQFNSIMLVLACFLCAMLVFIDEPKYTQDVVFSERRWGLFCHHNFAARASHF